MNNCPRSITDSALGYEPRFCGGSTPSEGARRNRTMSQHRTLLLDQGYQPISAISWQRAVTLLTLGKVEVIETYKDRKLRSRTWVIKMPAVVRLVKAFKRHKKRVKFSRHNVLARDHWKCQYCGKKKPTQELTYDHVIPRAQGGITKWENIVTCCVDCNSRKGGRTPQQAGMRLISQPVRPSWVPIFSITTKKGNTPEEWRDYIYWFEDIES